MLLWPLSRQAAPYFQSVRVKVENQIDGLADYGQLTTICVCIVDAAVAAVSHVIDEICNNI